MLALLKPWRTKQDLKTDDQSWATAFASFVQNGLIQQKCIIASILYYYESKMACDSTWEDNNKQMFSTFHGNAIPDELEEVGGEEISIPLNEDDLEQFKRDQVSPREEAHAAATIHIALS